MCTVSNVGDQWGQTAPYRWPNWFPDYQPPFVPIKPQEPLDIAKLFKVPDNITRDEFDSLKKEVEELKKLLLAAKRFDEVTGQPDCEMDSKVELIKKIAKALDVDMEGVFKSG